MKAEFADSVPRNKAMRFIRENGVYTLALELLRRGGVLCRRWLFARKLGCPNIVLGPRCFIRGLSHISIGRNFQAAEGLWLEAVVEHEGQRYSPRILIGENVSISRWSHIGATNLVKVDDGVLIGS